MARVLQFILMRAFLCRFFQQRAVSTMSPDATPHRLFGEAMIQLDSGNVLLKPSQRKQLMTWLRRSLRLGKKLGDFLLSITLKRVGRSYDVHASVHDRAGDFRCHARRHDLRNALRDLSRMLSSRLHEQCLVRAAA